MLPGETLVHPQVLGLFEWTKKTGQQVVGLDHFGSPSQIHIIAFITFGVIFFHHFRSKLDKLVEEFISRWLSSS